MSQFNSQFATIDTVELDRVTGGGLFGKAFSLGKKAFDKVKDPAKKAFDKVKDPAVAAWRSVNIFGRATDDK